jgi:hypothetical protein
MKSHRLIPLVLFAACGGADEPSSFAVVSVSPSNDASNIALDTPITLELSAPPAADFDVALTSSDGEAIAHTVQIAGQTVTLTPTHPLPLAAGHVLAPSERSRSLTDAPLEAGFRSRFETRDGAWKPFKIHTAAQVAPVALGAGAAPSLAVTDDGTVLTSWEFGAEVFDQRFTPGAGWLGAAGQLSLGGDPDFVQTAAASATRGVAAYQEYRGVNANIQARSYDGAAWSTPVTVAPYKVGATLYDQYLGGIAAAPQTHALTFHRGSFTTDTFDLFASISSNGTWSAPIPLEQLPGVASDSKIAADGSGGYVILWSQRSVDRLSSAVWMTTLSAQGTVGTPQKLDDGLNQTGRVSVVRAPDRLWLAWSHEENDDVFKSRIVVRSYSSSGLGEAHKISANESFGGEWVSLTASRSGALVTWTEFGAVHAAFERAGQWSQPATIEARPSVIGDEVGRPAITLDDRGNATVMWTRVPKSGRRASYVSRLRDGGWSAPSPLDGGTANTYLWAAGVDAAGRVTALWTESTTNGYLVWSGRLE